MSGSVTSEKNIMYKSSCKIKGINELGKRIEKFISLIMFVIIQRG